MKKKCFQKLQNYWKRKTQIGVPNTNVMLMHTWRGLVLTIVIWSIKKRREVSHPMIM